MPSDHFLIVRRIHTAQRPTGEPASNLAFLLALLAALPQDERAGLLRKDVGENIVFYAPKNVSVSMGRICYPNGELRKVLTDVGPGGANGPAWNLDGSVNANLWIEVSSVSLPPPDEHPTEFEVLRAELSALQRQIEGFQNQMKAMITNTRNAIEMANDSLSHQDEQLIGIHRRQDRAYVGAVGWRLRLTPEADKE